MHKLGSLILAGATIAVLLLLTAGPGTRLGWWEFRFGFTLMRWAVYIGGASALLAMFALIIPRTRSGRTGLLSMALAMGLVAASIPYLQMQKARSVPRIHDITTDVTDPPAFQAILPLRADAPNPPEYQGEEIAKQQRQAYPDIVPLMIKADTATVFARALQSARDSGWEIIAAEPSSGIIEATDTTFWFGFKDDVVIRVTAAGDGSRVDVRSKSRVGLSDVGANAARIRSFIARMQGVQHADSATPT